MNSDEEVTAYKLETNERFDALEKKLDDGMGRLDASMAAIKEELKQLILGRVTQSETMPETTKSATKAGPYIPPIPRFNDGPRRDYDDIGFPLPNNTLESSSTMGKNYKFRHTDGGSTFVHEMRWYEQQEPFESWDHRKEELLDRFQFTKEGDLYQQFLSIVQTRTLREYRSLFEKLAGQLTGISEKVLYSTFIKGLKSEIRSAGKSSYNPEHAITKNVGDTSSHMSSTLLGSQNSSNISRARNQFKKLTDSELHEKLTKGLCFRCGQKYGPGHQCPSLTLQVLLVGENDEESLEEDMEVEDVDHAHLDVIEVSLNSVMGFTSNHTMKLRGIIGDIVVVVLIDSGATHNFMSTRVVKQLGIMVMDSSQLTLTLGNGQVAHSEGICKGVVISLPGMQLIEDFLPLELGSTDVILGIKWLQTLGNVNVNWKLLTITFMGDRGKVTLVGDHGLCHSKAVAGLLNDYGDIFTMPNTLPPNQEHEHAIVLQDGVVPVSVRPYRYPQVQKDEIEKLVRKMLETGIIQPSVGLTSYYRKFMKGYSSIAAPLTNQLKKDSFKWGEDATNAFEALKKAMAELPMLALPNFNQPFVIEADAFGYGVGAVLMQDKRPIEFYSQVLRVRARLKSVYERELMAIVLAIKKWRPYLMGRKFFVRTDQKSLKYLLEQRIVLGEHERWVSKLLGYDFEIQYFSRKENHVADSLSRRAVSTQLGSLSVPLVLDWKELSEEIENDPDLSTMRQKLLNGEKISNDYQLDGRRLLYQGRLVLPRSSPWIPELFNVFHNSVVGGHSGVLNTFKRMASELYWIGMKKDIEKLVADCVICQRQKYSTMAPGGLLQPLELPTKIWTEVSMDFIDGLPKSDGYTVIMVVVDWLSKYDHFIPMRHPYTAITVATTFLREVIRLHGIPESIVSDRDKTFLSKQRWLIDASRLIYVASHQILISNGFVGFHEVNIDRYLEERDKVLEELKEQLNNAQERMKRYADEHRRDVEFNEAKNGEGVDSASSNLPATLTEDMEIILTPEQVEGIRGGALKRKRRRGLDRIRVRGRDVITIRSQSNKERPD
ncbi:putative mitochondrial protein [Tanacetum coccineum]|uniref:Mitochondrial protein n=1 Tax=Tanacetum coccineum TaxID=301880 RepID=A0ABQ4YD10_9ASTR